jgi:hypothetical protein
MSKDIFGNIEKKYGPQKAKKLRQKLDVNGGGVVVSGGPSTAFDPDKDTSTKKKKAHPDNPLEKDEGESFWDSTIRESERKLLHG